VVYVMWRPLQDVHVTGTDLVIQGPGCEKVYCRLDQVAAGCRKPIVLATYVGSWRVLT